jgi:hypothetical protein
MAKAGAIIIGIIILACIGLGFYMKSTMSPPVSKSGNGSGDGPPAPPVLSSRYTQAEAYAKANPYEYENIISRFQHISRQAKRGSEEAHLARNKVKAAQKEWHHIQFTVMPPLLKKTNALALQGKFDEAVKMLEEYEGEYKLHSQSLRKKTIMDYKTRKQQKAAMDRQDGSGPTDQRGGDGGAPPESRDPKKEEKKE